MIKLTIIDMMIGEQKLRRKNSQEKKFREKVLFDNEKEMAN